jgi:hypothetical protein
MKNIFVCMLLVTSPLLAQNAIDYNRAGVYYGKKGDFLQSQKNFDYAIDLVNQSSAKVYYNMGVIKENQSLFDEALKYYEKSIERNPHLVNSLERAGELYFNAGEFDRAIIAGEAVLAIEPKNQNVIPWLEKAYTERFKVKTKDISIQQREDFKKQAVQAVEQEKKDKQEAAHIVDFSLGGIYRYSYIQGTTKKFKYVKTPGSFNMNFPYNAECNVMPGKNWILTASEGTPYLGALVPPVINRYERFEVSFSKDNFILGAGIKGYHYKDDTFYGSTKSLNDYKFGIVIGRYSPQSVLNLSLYPILIPYDAGYKPNKTFDVSSIEVKYSYRFNDRMKLYSRFKTFETYFYDHAIPVSHYSGFYDATIGAVFFDSAASKFRIAVDFTERLNLRDYNNTKPYSFMNGQGFFGFNRNKWFKGDPMSGYYALSHIFSLRTDEKLGINAYLYQKIIVELVSRSKEQQDFAFELGAGGYF